MTQVSQDKIAIDLFMPIETPRLTIRPLMPGDGAEVTIAKEETWDQLHQWMDWAKEKASEAENEKMARDSYAKFLLGDDFNMVAIEKETGRMALFTGLHRIHWRARRFEIGFWARKSMQGHGFVQESTNALTRFAFGALGAKSVCISHADGNGPSRKVIEALRFAKEGTMRYASVLPDGKIVDQHWYSRTDIEGLPEIDVRWRIR